MKLTEHKIKASLTYGKVFLGKEKCILYFGLFISLLFPIITICIFITVAFEEMELLFVMGTPLIFGNIFSIVFFIVILWRTIYNQKLIVKIKAWLDDAILINASGRRLDLAATRKTYQIEVTFIFDNKIQKHISRAGNAIIGYYRFFPEPNKKIKILYSAKYNEVLILKG